MDEVLNLRVNSELKSELERQAAGLGVKASWLHRKLLAEGLGVEASQGVPRARRAVGVSVAEAGPAQADEHPLRQAPEPSVTEPSPRPAAPASRQREYAPISKARTAGRE